jgi:hypothetical protein
MVLVPDEVRRAVELQRASHALLRWMVDAAPAWGATVTHDERALPVAIAAWLERDGAWLGTVVAEADRPAIANLLASYLETTYAYDPAPGERLYSPSNHCFCELCSWMIALPRLRPRGLARADKLQARALRAATVHALARALGCPRSDAEVEAMLDEPALREDLALVAYAHDLARRIAGHPTTAASLALWRGFAWTAAGSPRKGFQLDADAILASEQRLIARLRD